VEEDRADDYLGRYLPPALAYRHVSGLNPGVRNDAGFYPSAAGGVVVIAIMLSDLPSDAAGEELLARTAQRIYAAAP
jgi:hypothetical protein